MPKGKEAEYALKKYQGSIFLSDVKSYGQELVLKPGLHRFRVAVVCPSARAPFYGSVRAVSNAIEVETESNAEESGE